MKTRKHLLAVMVVLLLANDAAAELLFEAVHLGGKAFVHPDLQAGFSARIHDGSASYRLSAVITRNDTLPRVVTAAPDDLAGWQRALVINQPIQLSAIEHEVQISIPDEPSHYESMVDGFEWTRFAAAHGPGRPGLSGYDITAVEMTIDSFEVSNIMLNNPHYGPISTHTGQHTLRIFGDELPPIVEPPGDYNRNGEVDAADYVFWRHRFVPPYEGNLPNERISVGFIGMDDYEFWRSQFGRSGMAAPSASIPEPPSTLLLVALALGAVMVNSRYRKYLNLRSGLA